MLPDANLKKNNNYARITRVVGAIIEMPFYAAIGRQFLTNSGMTLSQCCQVQISLKLITTVPSG